ncbi:SAM-dependent methyltransferase [Sphingobium sp. B7D2B]|uniref:BREX-1 system adenine-specific DNA-methyltransferase PglX n=1 Tax=Sphingobium sp. B7D2B TaxID=2940583 RepID=UPI002224FEA3|nr:BREX-1 system adenine-specific DNA-methyltransferase PglX [Sphingobium sp. B7D2B]MCW2364821.1 SAM-dependent methyltransferase [Sphingobium sp. B7D2B]
MDTNALKKFAQSARNLLIAQVTARLDMVLAEGAAARREHPAAIARLEAAASGNRGQVIEQAAYTWFNRFTALRFMDVTGLTNSRVVSPADGATRPEILAEAMAGNLPDRARPEIAEYLNGTRPAHDGQAEAYRLLLIHACNEWHHAMPYMFERADMLDRAEDYTELLIPDDLLSPDSILARLREVMTDEACQDVEIIGWLYQFYISEKKDQVFAGLKKNQKITAENIPAATQLFTPHWIVRYLVENSLGRLWLLNRPQSGLAAKMDYYIAPEEPETDFLRIQRAEEIRICDPACGSGHMLTYAFDLLYEIYAEEGHDADEIPGLILQHNLTGIEIDDRAGALAAFALSMKAAAKLGRRRFLRMEAKPDIVVLQNVCFTPAEMQDVSAVVGKDLFTDELRETLGQFEQAKNFGSLIVPKLRDPAEALRVVDARDFGSDLMLHEVRERVVAVLRMAELLAPKYHVVVANPPYMGGKGMHESTSSFLRKNYEEYKADLFSAFMVRIQKLARRDACIGLMTPFVWMFISTFEKLRDFLLTNQTMSSLVRPEYHAFFDSAYVPICAFVLTNGRHPERRADFFDLSEFYGAELQPKKLLEAINNGTASWRHRLKASALENVPGEPFCFWLSEAHLAGFADTKFLGDVSVAKKGLTTGDNSRFLRLFWEVASASVSFINADRRRFVPHLKGGDSRKWYGNKEFLLAYGEADLAAMAEAKGHRRDGVDFFFRAGITWSDVSSSHTVFRTSDDNSSFNNVAPTAFFESEQERLFAFRALNSVAMRDFVHALNPTLHFNPGDFRNLPFPKAARPSDADEQFAAEVIFLAKSDWDAYETSWDFTSLPLLLPDHRAGTMEDSYVNLRAHWQGMTDGMQALEEENNRIFIDAYGLADELTPDVPIEEITLTCNPAYRYGVKGSEEDRETRLREDTVAEFLHYAVGCMFGRYSLDAPGLILANQGEGIEDYLARVSEPSFAPDRDNVIPVLDTDWFADDIVTRARDFLRVTFGEAKFRENLAFVEAALGKDLRKWFTKDFFDYHVRRYKKRPIYWMFSSPKGSFNALIYMHRYRPDTVSVVLNQYVREFIHKLEVERARLEKLALDPTATPAQQTKAQKETATVIKQIAELTEWERDVVYPMAQQKIAIDLDDGVKRNYPLFAGALKPIKGLEATDD